MEKNNPFGTFILKSLVTFSCLLQVGYQGFMFYIMYQEYISIESWKYILVLLYFSEQNFYIVFINDNNGDQYWLLQHVIWTHLHPEVFYIFNASQHA